MSRYPTDLDDDSNLPNPAGYRQDGTRASDGAFLPAAVHSTLVRVLQVGMQAVQRKLGRGDSTAALDRVLIGTGPGLSEWKALAAFAVTKFGVGTGQPGQALIVDSGGQTLAFGNVATDAKIALHEADTTNVHGIADTSGLVLTGDARLSNQRIPTDSSVTDAKVAATAAIAKSKLAPLAVVNADVDAAAGIAESKLALASDAAVGVPSRRTLGTGALQAVPGTHVADVGAGKHVFQQPAIANLSTTVSNPPTQAEVQSIVTKVNALLASLRTGGELAP